MAQGNYKAKRAGALAVLIGLMGDAAGMAQTKSPVDLTQMNLEELMDVKVTSVSKKEEKLSRTAAAVFVITQDDIRRSGATNIPDVLRMAPGVDVEQIDANAWAISIRGFNERYSNKVLVMIDGRSVYTPSFSGVFWEQIGLPLEDIDRIEVIRGPGATVWGANAVNGVISIMTKSAKDTKGGLVSAAAGSELRGEGMVQYGGTAGKGASYRVFGDYFNVGDGATAGRFPANDRWSRSHAGGRLDWDVSGSDQLMVQGDLFSNRMNETHRSGYVPTPYDTITNESADAAGGDVMARWTHTTAGGSQTSVQSYFDTYRRTDFGVPEIQRTVDLDFQDHVALDGRHDIVWGAGYRTYTSGLTPGYSVSFAPPKTTESLYSAFLQDEIRLADTLWFTIGGKLEHNPYTGLQTEPSLRLAWNPAARHTLWASASKAVRQPSRADANIQLDIERVPLAPGLLQVLRVYGNPNILNEEARDYELGYRADFSKTLSLDVASFLTFYHHLETVEPQGLQIVPGPPVELMVPMLYENKAHAVDYGGEVSLKWTVNSRWRITPTYSYLHATIRQDPSSMGLPAASIAPDFPQNMFRLRSQWNVSRRMEFDQSVYYTARIPGSPIAGHTRVDLRLARRLGESTEVSVVGQNLLRPSTMEYGDSYGVIATETQRSVYGKVTWRF